jgi:hypothetical protein
VTDASAAALVLAEALLASEQAADRIDGWEIIGELSSGQPANGAAALPLARAAITSEADPEVLEAAVWALSTLETDGVLDAVIAHAESPETAVRLAVVRAIPSCVSGEVDERAITALIVLSGDEDGDVRDWSTFALGTLFDDVDTPQLREALAARLPDQHADARAEAMVGLATRGDPRAFAATLAELTSGCVGRLAVEAAALVGDHRLQQALSDLRSWWDVDPQLLERAIRSCEPAPDPADARQFAQSNAGGRPGSGYVAGLLRRVADTLDELGDVQVRSITFSSQVTHEEDDLTITVDYYDKPRRRAT